MPKFRRVEVAPSEGWPDKSWTSGPADLEAFPRITRSLCELYSQVLPDLHLTGKATLLRLNLDDRLCRQHPAPTASPADLIQFGPRLVASREIFMVKVPIGYSELPVDQQRRLASALR